MAVNQQHAWRGNVDAWGSSDEAEPSWGWTGHGRGHPEMALLGYDYDREHDDEREPGCDREPEDGAIGKIRRLKTRRHPNGS